MINESVKSSIQDMGRQEYNEQHYALINDKEILELIKSKPYQLIDFHHSLS